VTKISVPTKSGLNLNPKPSRKDFDSVLKQLCDTTPLPNKKVKFSRRKKLGKILGKPDGNQ
jgi:hypothetical protein